MKARKIMAKPVKINLENTNGGEDVLMSFDEGTRIMTITMCCYGNHTTLSFQYDVESLKNMKKSVEKVLGKYESSSDGR